MFWLKEIERRPKLNDWYWYIMDECVQCTFGAQKHSLFDDSLVNGKSKNIRMARQCFDKSDSIFNVASKNREHTQIKWIIITGLKSATKNITHKILNIKHRPQLAPADRSNRSVCLFQSLCFSHASLSYDVRCVLCINTEWPLSVTLSIERWHKCTFFSLLIQIRMNESIRNRNISQIHSP